MRARKGFTYGVTQEELRRHNLSTLLRYVHQHGPTSRAVLTDVAGEHPGLTVREVDVAVRPELVRLLGIRRTPTTLVVDPAGVELARHVGVPRRADLLGSLAPWRRTG